MQNISIISPIKTPEDIKEFSSKTGCNIFYVYYHKFLNSNFEKVHDYIKAAVESGSKIYINFKHNICENNLQEIIQFIEYLKNTKIDGIFINSYAILGAIKSTELPFEVIIDSYFDIHNISGIEFLKTFKKIDGLILTEEIYMKNIAKIKKYTDLILAIDTDNLPWCIADIKKNKSISATVIKGDFNSSDSILQAIQYIENVINFPDKYKNKKLPFKHVRKGLYETNHFTGEIFSTRGEDFKFSKHIQKYDWNYKRVGLIKGYDYKSLKLPNLTLRLSSVKQLQKIKTFIDKIGFNPIFSIEYGEIVSTCDLAKKSYTQVINCAKKFCNDNNILFSLSTPKILIERDFDRVYEYVKTLCLSEPYPSSVIINNIGYFWTFINDSDINEIPVEIGYGINLLNSMSIFSLNNIHNLQAVDVSVIHDKKLIEQSLKAIKKYIPRRKLTIAGNIRIPSLGLCPLNNKSAIISRLSCKAPCQGGTFAINDPSLNQIYPFIVDGFCKMHMYKDKIMNIFSYIPYFQKIGINEFVIDMNNLSPKFVGMLLTTYLNVSAGLLNTEENDWGEYNLFQ